MEKNLLGNIYGSRLSKNGKWLNLIITTEINGEKGFITCPVRISKDDDEDTGKKPYAIIEMACDVTGRHYPVGKAIISNLPLYEDRKPDKEEKGDPNEFPF